MTSLTLEDRVKLLAGKVSMRQLAGGAAAWLRPELVRTAAARDRLRAWCEAGGLERPPMSRDEIVDQLSYVGPPYMGVAVALAVESMAPPARDYVLDHVQFIALGEHHAGWIAGVRTPRLEARQTIAIAGVQNDSAGTFMARRTTLHECAHAWLEPSSLPPTVAMQRQAAKAAASAAGKLYSAADIPIELRAWSLAEVWEGAPFGGDFWLRIRRALR